MRDFVSRYIVPNHGEEPAATEGYETLSEWANTLHIRLNRVKLVNTDGNRLLRETFQHQSGHDSFLEQPSEGFLADWTYF